MTISLSAYDLVNLDALNEAIQEALSDGIEEIAGEVLRQQLKDWTPEDSIDVSEAVGYALENWTPDHDDVRDCLSDALSEFHPDDDLAEKALSDALDGYEPDSCLVTAILDDKVEEYVGTSAFHREVRRVVAESGDFAMAVASLVASEFDRKAAARQRRLIDRRLARRSLPFRLHRLRLRLRALFGLI